MVVFEKNKAINVLVLFLHFLSPRLIQYIIRY